MGFVVTIPIAVVIVLVKVLVDSHSESRPELKKTRWLEPCGSVVTSTVLEAWSAG
jgi:capsular polysaccharide biosynthesis protein